jgi:hypothetical protein
MPGDRAAYFAVDYDEPDADKPTIASYLRGAASVVSVSRDALPRDRTRRPDATTAATRSTAPT